MNHHMLDVQALTTAGARFAILSVGRYSLPVRFRVRPSALECLVPTWSGVGDLLDPPQAVTLVVVAQTEPDLRWYFVRGEAAVVTNPDWEGLQPPLRDRVSPDDLYQLLRITPRRIELIDEGRSWGYRETVDL